MIENSSLRRPTYDHLTNRERIAGVSHNQYSQHIQPPSKSHNEEEELNTFAVLPQALDIPGEYIFLEDFNLHHSL
jgi:hypothetical protein